MFYAGTGHMTVEEVMRYASEQSGWIERGPMRRHLNDCADCRSRVIDVRDELRLAKLRADMNK
jgi:hypothetical protein